MNSKRPFPLMSDAGLAPVHPVTAVDENGESRDISIAGEQALTVYVNKREVVTLMTLGTRPEALTLGYLRNQGFIESLAQVQAVQVDWDTEAAVVVVGEDDGAWQQQLQRRTVTSGCGQGTMFGSMLDKLQPVTPPEAPVRQSDLYRLLDNLSAHNAIYRAAGAVHSCALCADGEPLYFVEDVGRHNAVDTISGQMWLDGIGGADKVFYTTGRLTSEMVIKVGQMGVPVLLSRSGVTAMGLELARRIGLILIGRAKGRHFLVFNGAERIAFDVTGPQRAVG